MANNKSVFPKASWLILTSRCNNRCAQCYQGEKTSSAREDMPFEDAKIFLTLLKDLGLQKCVLIGGEPTLYRRLNEVMQCGTDHGITMLTMTNGSIFSKRESLKAALKSGLGGYTVSIEGPTDESHDSMTRRKGSFKQSIQALKNGLEMHADVASISTISQLNKDSVIEIYENMRAIGILTIIFNVCTTSLCGNNTGCLIPMTEAAEKLKILFSHVKEDLMQNPSLKVKAITPLPLCLFDPKTVPLMKETGFFKRSGGCQMFYGAGIAINFDGEILPCCHWVGCSLGNIQKIFFDERLIPREIFQKWWQEEAPAKFREELIKYPSSKCSNCSEWGTQCVGGCPLFWLQHDAEKCIPGFDSPPLSRVKDV